MAKAVSRSILIAIVAVITLFLNGCLKPQPLSMAGHGVLQIKSDPVWLRDSGPERSGHFRSLAIADFNNDGKLDIVGGSYEPGAIFLWFGDGFGNWERIQRFKIKGDIRSIAVGDINNDGFPDIISSSSGDTKGIQVWINNKVLTNEDSFFKAGKSVTERELYEGLKLADINNDGNLDIIAANSTDVNAGGIQVWLGDGNANFITETGPTRKGIYYDVAVGDINNDGKLDIVGAGWGDVYGGLRAWLGSGDGRWSGMQQEIEKVSFWGVILADINGDGNLDIIAASNFDGVAIFYGDGKGHFPKKERLAESGSFWRVKAVDLNKDGFLDVVATSNDGKGIVVWYQQRIGNEIRWVAKDEGLPTDGFYFDIAFADFNYDGRTDIAASTQGEGIKVWLRAPGEPIRVKREVIKEKEIVEKTVEKIVEKEKIIEKKVLVIPVFYTAVFFDAGKAELRSESMVILNSVSEFLKRVDGAVVKLEGYADPRRIMTQAFPNNQILSEARVKSVTKYLLDNGIQKNRIEGSGFGDSLTKYSGSDPDSMQKNRRVDITIIYKGGNPPEKEKEKTNNPNNEQKKSIETMNKQPLAKKIYTNRPPMDAIHLPVLGTIACAECHEGMTKGDDREKLLRSDPFVETGDIVPVVEYKVFKLINNVPEYRIGSGDQLEIVFWEGIKENTYKVPVSVHGTLSFSYIKDFKASGLTQTELEMEFVKLLKKYVKDPLVKVYVAHKAAHKASIFGAVRDLSRQPTGPGAYIMFGRERLSEFLSRAGGHLPNADLTRIQLTRAGKTYFINLFDAVFKADFRQDIIIDAADVIFIPSKSEIKNKVFVFGEVFKPGLFQYDVNISLLEAMVRSGGPTFYGKAEDVIIIRGDETKPEAVKINLRDIYEKGDFRKNIALQNNDIVYVAKNVIGDIRDFVRNLSPFITIIRLPMDLYGATAVPIWEGFPLRREAAPTPTAIITTQPGLPPEGGGGWGESK